jgi:hypothetical protein
MGQSLSFSKMEEESSGKLPGGHHLQSELEREAPLSNYLSGFCHKNLNA